MGLVYTDGFEGEKHGMHPVKTSVVHRKAHLGIVVHSARRPALAPRRALQLVDPSDKARAVPLIEVGVLQLRQLHDGALLNDKVLPGVDVDDRLLVIHDGPPTQLGGCRHSVVAVTHKPARLDLGKRRLNEEGLWNNCTKTLHVLKLSSRHAYQTTTTTTTCDGKCKNTHYYKRTHV